jgi:CRP/FNR family cyclic AMP-dependent transcriptional regulator
VVTLNKNPHLRRFSLFQGLDSHELERVGRLCGSRSFAVGEICQSEGRVSDRVHFIVSGKIGALLQVPGDSPGAAQIVVDTLGPGDLFGWSALIKGSAWSTLRVLERTEALYAEADELLALCQADHHLGFILMRNLAALAAQRLRLHRVSILKSIIAIKGD